MDTNNLHEKMQVVLSEYKNEIYGMVIDFDVNEVSYIGCNKDFLPLIPSIDGSEIIYNSWDGWEFIFQNRPAMCKMNGEIDYYLDSKDYFKKVDGSKSDVDNIDYEGNAMAVIPKVYSCSYTIAQKRYVYFSMNKISENFLPVGFDVEGVVRNYMLIPMFYGSVDRYGRMRSISGQWSAGSSSGAAWQNIYNTDMDTDAQMEAITKTDGSALFFGGAIVNILCDIITMLTKTLPEKKALGDGVSKGCTEDNDCAGHWGTKVNAALSSAFSGHTNGNEFGTMFHSLVPASSMLWQRDPYIIIKYGKLFVSKDYHYDISAESYTDTGLRFEQSGYYKKTIFIEGFGAFPDAESFGSENGCFMYAKPYVVSTASRFGCIRNGDKRSLFMFSVNHSGKYNKKLGKPGTDISNPLAIDESFSWWWNFGASLMQPQPVFDM